MSVIGAWLPLQYAAMCLNESTIYDIRNRACPTCGSKTFVLLATWLRARTDKKAEW